MRNGWFYSQTNTFWREQRYATAGVWRKFGGRSKKSEKKKLRDKQSWESMINIIFKNNTMIRILAIELLNTILLLAF
jgi:hypothetical protein